MVRIESASSPWTPQCARSLASPSSMTALIALVRANTVLAWDPTNRALIAANIVGTMAWTKRT